MILTTIEHAARTGDENGTMTEIPLHADKAHSSEPVEMSEPEYHDAPIDPAPPTTQIVVR